jgi:hypothetical protein
MAGGDGFGLRSGAFGQRGMVEEIPRDEVKPPRGSNWVEVGWRGSYVVQGGRPAMVAVGEVL